jgi:glutaredoxin 3
VLELFGSPSCPYTAQLRDDLQWRGEPFVEHDIDADERAYARMLSLTGGDRMIPVLSDGERIVQVGYEGRGCYANGV